MTKEDAEIGQRLRRLRVAATYSQSELAALLSRSATQTWAHKVEKGLQPLRLAEASRIADIFGVTVDAMVSDSALEAALPGVVSQSQVLKSRARYERARAELERAEAALSES